jgi:uncharacterized membrane protein
VSSLIREPRQSPRLYDWRPLGVAGLVMVALLAFLLAPGSVAWKTHVALHGLCAQRPTHSLHIGGATLPMDARMTGIYIGAAVAICWLVALGRLQAIRTPTLPVMLTMTVFVLAIAVDGFNALLVDLGSPHPYEPSNQLRLITGILAGTALGIGLGHVFAVSIWTRVDRLRAVVASPLELLVPIGMSAAISTLAMLNLPILYAPFAIGILVATLGVFSLMGMIVAAIVTDRRVSPEAIYDLAPFMLTGFIAAIVTIAGFSWSRFAAEQFFGLPQLT